jgi:periplasmic divalent cation tolerance protein
MEKRATDGDSGVCVVFVTVPDVDAGCRLARRVVQEHLAACGNVIPGLTSVYRWKGEVQEEGEALVLFKTTMAGLDDLEKRVLELHPYDVPEFLSIPVADGHAPYLKWVREEVAETGTSG